MVKKGHLAYAVRKTVTSYQEAKHFMELQRRAFKSVSKRMGRSKADLFESAHKASAINRITDGVGFLVDEKSIAPDGFLGRNLKEKPAEWRTNAPPEELEFQREFEAQFRTLILSLPPDEVERMRNQKDESPVAQEMFAMSAEEFASHQARLYDGSAQLPIEQQPQPALAPVIQVPSGQTRTRKSRQSTRYNPVAVAPGTRREVLVKNLEQMGIALAADKAVNEQLLAEMKGTIEELNTLGDTPPEAAAQQGDQTQGFPDPAEMHILAGDMGHYLGDPQTNQPVQVPTQEQPMAQIKQPTKLSKQEQKSVQQLLQQMNRPKPFSKPDHRQMAQQDDFSMLFGTDLMGAALAESLVPSHATETVSDQHSWDSFYMELDMELAKSAQPVVPQMELPVKTAQETTIDPSLVCVNPYARFKSDSVYGGAYLPPMFGDQGWDMPFLCETTETEDDIAGATAQ